MMGHKSDVEKQPCCCNVKNTATMKKLFPTSNETADGGAYLNLCREITETWISRQQLQKHCIIDACLGIENGQQEDFVHQLQLDSQA